MVNLIEQLRSMPEEKRIPFNNSGCQRYMLYNGRFSDVLNQFQRGLQESNPITLFLYSTRILAGVIDYALDKKEDILPLKQKVEQLCSEVFLGNNANAANILRETPFCDEMRNYQVIERGDHVSWYAFNPIHAQVVARQMIAADFSPDYIVIDGHDGARPGFMVGSLFNAQAISIRNSQDSGRDNKTKPLPGEVEEFMRKFRGKRILIFGEDISSGRAINSLYELVMRNSSPAKIKIGANLLVSDQQSKLKRSVDFYAERRHIFS